MHFPLFRGPTTKRAFGWL
ncbi:hypothetical protein Godav_011276 [Gossypium davidsonii]|uniref:Uncharacterized protein n=1 Tax=Gossypium davidsonii TaxID=34287 RepID=A0A7J8R9C7_GOSDV|nr:hypothetical protein [Gossypium davidsonii]